MRFVWALSLLFVLAALPQASAGEGTGTIHATVCIEYTVPDDHGYHGREPYFDEDECWMDTVEHAAVTATSADGAVYTSKADFHGVAVLPDIPAGRYTLTVDAPGFEVDEKWVDVWQGQRNHTVLWARTTEVDITGHLVDGELSPVAYTALWFDGPAGSWNVTTDAEGAFSATVQTGYHYLELEAPGYRSGWSPVFIDGASPIDLMVLAQDGGATLRGQVVDQDDEPVPHAEIDGWSEPDEPFWGRPWSPEPERRDGYQVVSDQHMDTGFHTMADDEGRFTVEVAPGWGDISVWADGYRGAHRDFELAEGDTLDMTLVLERLPEKEAHVVGTVVDAVTGAPVESFSVNLNNQAFHEWTCSRSAQEMQDERHGRYGRGCDITTTPGSFEGHVMPGYSVLEVGAHADCESSCRDRYIRHIETVVLEPGTNTFTIELQRRSAADAAVNGYVLDAEGEPVQHVAVHFRNEESHGWGDAGVDEFGSYRVMLRAGWHQVSVWAPGYYEWQGMVQAVSGQEMPLDIHLTEDPEWDDLGYGYRGGHRPYHGGPPMPIFHEDTAYAKDMPNATGKVAVVTMTAGSTSVDTAFESGESDDGGDADGDFVDLGGLGESYDASDREAKRLASQDDQHVADAQSGGGLDIPALPLALLAAALVGISAMRRS